VVFEDDKRNPWDESSDFKRPPMWPHENDLDAQTLWGKADSMMKNAVTSASKILGEAFTNPSSIMKTVHEATQMKEDGVKVLFPLLQQGVESHFVTEVSKFSPKSLIQNQLNTNAMGGINGKIATAQLSNPLRQGDAKKPNLTTDN